MPRAFLFTLTLLALNFSARAELYFFSALPPADPHIDLAPTGINNKGDVVGAAYTPMYMPAAFRYSGGKTTILPGQDRCTGLGINSSGTIIGYADVQGQIHAVYASPGGQIVDMLSSQPDSFSEGFAINDSNYVIGVIDSEPFLGNTNGWLMRLGSTLGKTFYPAGLNNHFVIVGNGPWGGETYDALAGQITYLTWVLGSFNNKAQAINDSGMVAGVVGTQGFVYSGGSVAYFGTGVSQVTGMNAMGDVVGNLTAGHAFVYIHANGHFIDLNDAVIFPITFPATTWTIGAAAGINDLGVIVAKLLVLRPQQRSVLDPICTPLSS